MVGMAAIGSGLSAAGAIGGALSQDVDKPYALNVMEKMSAEDKIRSDYQMRQAMGGGFDRQKLAQYASKTMGLSGQKLKDYVNKAEENWKSSPIHGVLTKEFQFEKDPGYDFRMEEGAKGVERAAAARGGVLSGAAMKALENYRQGVASQEYGKAFDRYRSNRSDMYNIISGNQATASGNNQMMVNRQKQYESDKNAMKANQWGALGSIGDMMGGIGGMGGLGGGSNAMTGALNLSSMYKGL